MIEVFCFNRRNPGHWDVYPNSGHRLFRIRGSAGNFCALDERHMDRNFDESNWVSASKHGFATADLAADYICRILMAE